MSLGAVLEGRLSKYVALFLSLAAQKDFTQNSKWTGREEFVLGKQKRHPKVAF
jgi:hypothetical protein